MSETSPFSEFHEAYSDDLISIFEGRLALLTHPLRNELEHLVTASYARLLIVFVYSALEAMIASEVPDFAVVFTSGKRGETNKQKIAAFADALKHASIFIDDDLAEDLLAIKYLRNVIVHARWKPHERDWVVSRGFPDKITELGKPHWLKVLAINDRMLRVILGAKHQLPTLVRTAVQSELARFDVDESGLLKTSDLLVVLRLMLERIAGVVQKKIYSEEVARRVGELGSWQDHSGEEFWGLKRAFLGHVRELGVSDKVLFEREAAFGREALQVWRMLRVGALSNMDIGVSDLRSANLIYESLHREKSFPPLPSSGISRLMETESGQEALQQIWQLPTGLTLERVTSAFRAGKVAYELLGANITVAALFCIYFQVVDPENAAEYSDEGRTALEAYAAARNWIACFEHTAPRYGENFVICRAFVDDSGRTWTLQ